MIDFLIVGTFKSASSTLAYELGTHTTIDISSPKDPYFYLAKFCQSLTGPDGFVELQNAYSVYDRNEFEALFQRDAGATLKGEATPLYLYCHEHAIPAIRADNPGARIIIVLRNPIDRAFSNYMHNVKDGYESRDFTQCIATWKETENLPLHPFFHYVRAGFFDAQVAAYLHAFEHVKIVNYDDLKATPHTVLNEISSFLDIEPCFERRDVIRLNKSGYPRSRILHQFISHDSLPKTLLRPLFRIFFPNKATRIAISERVKNFNLRSSKMTSTDRDALAAIYRNDVLRLSDRVGQDLVGQWCL